MLEALGGLSGDIETLGTEELRGVDTTHYRVVLDPVALAKRATAGNPDATSLLGQLTGRDGMADVPLDVWIDGDGHVRKLSLDFEGDASSGRSGSASLAFELWDYGDPVEIDVPPASQVTDASSLHG